MWRSRINLLIILAGLASHTPTWATPKHFLPTGLEIGFDVARLPYYLWKEKTGVQYEFYSSVDFNRMLLEIDYGFGNILRKNPPKRIDNKPIIKTISYNRGQYFRIGLSYNFIPKNTEHNVACLGLMYSRSSFRDALYGNFITSGGYNQSETAVDTADNLHAHWIEIVAGVRVQVWQWVYMGCSARYKFAKQVSSSLALIPFDIIGWGLHEADDAWGVNYYISIRIPFPSVLNRSQVSLKSTKNNQLISMPPAR